jgi:hypothetical protein
LDNDAFGSADFFERLENGRILSERRYNGLVEPENGRTFLRPSEIALAKCSGLDGDRRCRRRR